MEEQVYQPSIFILTLQYVTIGIGFIAMAISASLFVHFAKSKRPLGKALSFMFLGESICMGMTVIFSIAAEGLIDIIGPYSALAIRWVMFFTALATSIHLAYRVWLLETGQDTWEEDFADSEPNNPDKGA